jgi:hypothetical protein
LEQEGIPMTARLARIRDVLEGTPAALGAMLERSPERLARCDYGEETWSPFDVVGHLIHGERTDWIPRTRIILEHGEAEVFPPFDMYAHYEASRGLTMGALLETFKALRRENLAALDGFGLTDAQLALRGSHPLFGAITLGEMLSMWAVHDLNHTAQIARCVAHQFEGSVGCYREYVSIFNQPVARMDDEAIARRRAAR